MPTRTKPSPKRVVYLWGAGATHAEAQFLGASNSLLMADYDHFGKGITSRILKRAGRRTTAAYGGDYFGRQTVDIEQLISLLAASWRNRG